ncbi:MAG: 3'(2'),5'-bisphosphate nucleotidase CysQ [Streptosporangiaceae bacterium]
MTTDDDRLARDLARDAGRLLLTLRAEGGEPGALRKAGDEMSHEFLAAQLSQQRPGDAVLSEEGRDDLARLDSGRVWIVDPLDGTREFGEPGRTDWAVHVALWERGKLTAGAVALPAQDTVLSTTEPPPAPPAATPGRPVRVLVSRTRPPALLDRLAQQIQLTLIPLGSAGAKAAEVVRGTADAYVHSGGQYEWDSAAPVAVAQAAGLHASRLDGSKLAYNQADPSLPDILICPAGLAPVLLDGLRVAGCSATR